VVGGFSEPTNFGDGLITPATGDTDPFVVELDPDGNYLWARTFPVPGMVGYAAAVATDGMGNVFVTGAIDASIDFGCGPLANKGATMWGTVFGGGDGHDHPPAGVGLALDGTGNVYVTGSFEDAIKFGGGTIPGGNPSIFVAKLSP
jgi:hypothetical protein